MLLLYWISAIAVAIASPTPSISGPWNGGDQFGDVVCQSSSASPFTSDCNNAIKALEAHSGAVPHFLTGNGCQSVMTYHTCVIAICYGVRVISIGEIAMWAAAINAQCSANVGINNLPVAGGQIGVRNSGVGNINI